VSLQLAPVTFEEACEFVARLHRHHRPPRGWKFGVGVERVTRAEEVELVGVALVGRPVARALQDGRTLEVTRCCTDGTKNAASMLYGACWRATKAMGYRRLITYTLAAEPGTTLRAAGWRELYRTPGRSWTTPSRPREDKHPLGQKRLWEVVA
jgi:hypothetical protein